MAQVVREAALKPQEVCRNKSTHGLQHLKIFVHAYFLSFGSLPSFGMKTVQSFVHDAPELFHLVGSHP